jgi:hypothetical protein
MKTITQVLLCLLLFCGCSKHIIDATPIVESDLPYSYSFTLSPLDGTDYTKTGAEKQYKLYIKESGNISLENKYQFYFLVPSDRSANAELFANGKSLGKITNSEKFYFKYADIFNKALNNELIISIKMQKPDIGTYAIGFSVASLKDLTAEKNIIRNITILF